jgi:hypothetical protein
MKLKPGPCDGLPGRPPGFQIGIATAAQFIAERAVNEGSELLREVEQQVRSLPGDLA